MNFTYLLMQSEDGVATITINRPQQANALNWETIRELKQAVETTRNMPETRVVVITGAGERTFVGPRALLLQKELLNRWLNLPVDEAIEAGIKSLAMAYATDAPQRAITAFWARRGKR